MKILLTQPGTQHSYNIATQLERMGILYCFATCFAVGNDNKISKWLPKGWRKKLARRTVTDLPGSRLYTMPLLEVNALWQLSRGNHREKVFFKRNKAFQQRIPQRLIEEATAVIGFDTASWILIERCKKAGKPYIMDASIAHPLSQQAVFNEIRNRFPLWAGQLPTKNSELIEIEQWEMLHSDRIMAASTFTKNTYLSNGVPASRISLNHYGIDASSFKSKWTSRHKRADPKSKVTFLYFSKISARKGFPWLCAIWDSFHQQYPNTNLIAAGYDSPPPEFEIPKGIELRGFVHPADRQELFNEADVFVFPSFFEGYALVIVEAMACGLPVITTTSTIGPEVITNYEEGFCIEAGDDDALLKSLCFFADHPEKISDMGKKGRKRIEPLGWDEYGKRLKVILESFNLNDPSNVS